MAVTRTISAFSLIVLLSCLLIGCVPPTLPEDVPDERLIDVGMPFERGMMAYLRDQDDVARQQLEAALGLNPRDERARYLLCNLDYEDCYRRSRENDPDLLPLAPDVENVQQYLALVETRSPRIRNAVFGIVEQKMILERKRYEVGPVLNVLLRFYPEAIFATLTQRLVDLAEYPADMSRQRSFLLTRVGHYVNVKDDVLTQAFDSYVDYATAIQQRHALRAELAAREHAARVMQLRVDNGYATRLSLTQTLAKRARTMRSLEAVKIRLASHRQTMADLAGIDAEKLAGLSIQHLDLPESDDDPELRTDELKAIANREYLDSLDVSDTISVLRLTKVNLFASWGDNWDNKRNTFVDGWSTGIRFQVPLMIWPMGKARIAQQDALIGKFETELEYSLLQARTTWLQTYKRFVETTTLYANARADTVVAKERVVAQENARRVGAPADRLQTIESFIAYYRSLYRLHEAAAKQQKAAFKWFRAQALSAQDVRFRASDGAYADGCRLENRYVVPAVRILQVGTTDSFAESGKTEFLIAFAKANAIETLVVPASAAALTEHAGRYRRLLANAQAAGIEVIGSQTFTTAKAAQATQATRQLRAIDQILARHDRNFDGIQLDLSRLPNGRDTADGLASLSDIVEVETPILLSVDWTALRDVAPATLGRLATGAQRVSILVKPSEVEAARLIFDRHDALRGKAYFTIDLEASRSGLKPPQQFSGIEDLVQQNCQLINHRNGLRQLGMDSFEDYMALMPR